MALNVIAAPGACGAGRFDRMRTAVTKPADVDVDVVVVVVVVVVLAVAAEIG